MSTFAPLLRLLRDEGGVTAVEYAVMLAMIVAACFGAIQFLGVEAASFFRSTADRLEAMAPQ